MNEQRMIGHYRVVELLGSGAMGTVHVAVDTFIERPVAIKSLRAELTRDPDFVSRFRAEAASLARLNHPNIATLYTPLMEGSDLYMVMELVRGRPLDEILRERGKPLGVKESLAIIAQAADGLAYAHEVGVIHRDIKPANLMIANDGRVKIMDFGIARVRGSVRLTRVGTAVGTPLYMSPEQCRGGEGDERSDVYSLAIVLYELLAGAPPFSGATEYDLIQAQIKNEPPPLVPRAPGVTPKLEAAIMTALAKRPEQRFQSVRAFSDAIGATELRLNATSVVRNATHLVEGPHEPDVPQKASGRALALVSSRAGTFERRLKGLPAAVTAAIVIVAGAALLTPFYLAYGPHLFGSGVSNAPGKTDAGRSGQSSSAQVEQPHARAATTEPAPAAAPQVPSAAKSSDAAPQEQPPQAQEEQKQQPVDKQVADNERAATDDSHAAASDQKPAANPSAPTPPAAAPTPPAPTAPAAAPPPPPTAPAAAAPAQTINDLRTAIKGNANERIVAADFANVNNEARAKSLPLARTLAATGDKEAEFALGMLLLEAPDHPDVEGAFAALSDAANQNYPDAQVNLALIYQRGLLKTGRDLDQAGYMFRRAAENGDPKAEFWLGCYYQYGWGGITKDRRKALEQYSKAVAGNYSLAQEALEIMTGVSKGASPCSK
jgi:serine/threonine-protein kinase